ncbi:MAG: site-specific DNA-methyltransferase [Planctomycetes bacterium]|nr:site-specific DNA-methyltransferase [Planctomycetota bacterium]
MTQLSDGIATRAPRNRTLSLTAEERQCYESRLLRLDGPAQLSEVSGRTICQDIFSALPLLPADSVDLLIADPPYNLSKTFNQESFTSVSMAEYERWLDCWIGETVRLLKPTASIYLCGDWRSSTAIQRACEKYFTIRNRITWEREKGRGAEHNWKNCSEDIWFCTLGRKYTFNVDAVKLKRRILAPYTETDGKPKGWQQAENGRYRLTYPSNLWTDITVPFWSMPENTDHPTQKPEKLIAKIILASSHETDVVFDPFLGSGTSSVVAKKTKRRFFGVEIDPFYGCLAEKRLAGVDQDSSIQGYSEGVFWERNTLSEQQNQAAKAARSRNTPLFDEP